MFEKSDCHKTVGNISLPLAAQQLPLINERSIIIQIYAYIHLFRTEIYKFYGFSTLIEFSLVSIHILRHRWRWIFVSHFFQHSHIALRAIRRRLKQEKRTDSRDSHCCHILFVDRGAKWRRKTYFDELLFFSRNTSQHLGWLVLSKKRRKKSSANIYNRRPAMVGNHMRNLRSSVGRWILKREVYASKLVCRVW